MAEAAEPPPFFQVPPLKLVLMWIATLGVYEIYWFYRHWRQVERWDVRPLMPLARSLFRVFFAYALFARLAPFAIARDVDPPPVRAGLLTIVYVVAQLLPLATPFGVLASPLAVISLALFQRHVKALHAKLGHAARGEPWFDWRDAAVLAGSLAFWLALAALRGEPWWAMW